MTQIPRDGDTSQVSITLLEFNSASSSGDANSTTPAAAALSTQPPATKEHSSTQAPNIPNVTENDEAQAQFEIRRGVATMNAAFDWTGPNDPDNPRNFPLAMRLYSAATITFLAMVVTVAGAMYAPAQEYVASAYSVSQEVAVLPLSLYNLGLAFGPLVGAPLSETYGRRAVFLVTAPTFMLFTLGAGFSKSVASLTICRFFAGMFGAPLINNAPATMLDFTPGLYRGVTLGVYYTIPSFGASLGPLMGGSIVQRGGWRWTQWAAIILASAFYVPMLFTRETYKKIILRRRAIRLGLYDSASQRTSPGRAFRYFATTLIQRPLHMLFTEPIVTLVSLYCGFLYGLLYTFVVAVPWIFRHYYGFNKDQESLSFLGLIVGTLLASIPLSIVDFRYYQPRLLRWQQQPQQHEQTSPSDTSSEPPPLPSENRLIGALFGSILLPASLFAVAWTAHARVHWIVPIFFQGCVMLASLLIYASASLFMLDAYGPLYGASASSAVMMTRYVLSAAFPLFALQLYKELGVGWATSLLAFVAVVMMPIPWCFWIYGEKLRKRSRYETST